MKNTHLLFYFLLAIIYTGCSNDCEEPQIVTVSSQNQGYMPPYSGADTLRFLHNNLDTQIYIGQGISYYTCGTEYDGTNPECRTEYQAASYSFFCMTNSNKITFKYCPYSSAKLNKCALIYYFNDIYSGELKVSTGPININGIDYVSVGYHSLSSDTIQYFAIAYGDNRRYSIVKIQYPGDTLTLIK